MKTKTIKRGILVLLAALMLASAFSLNIFAYANGSKTIYNGSTKLGVGDMWTNNSTTNMVLSACTEANSKSNSVSASATYTYMQTLTSGKRVKYMSSWATKENTYSTGATVEKNVTSGHTPVEARATFYINSYGAGVCKMYNYGQGQQTCEDGSSCAYNF